jgi:SAM-dependent methyltransferase
MPEAERNDVEATLAQPAVHLEWEANYRTEENERFYDRCFDELLREVGAPSGATFLDAGCGIGAHSVRLAEHGYRVVAVDFSENILADARKNVEAHGLAASIDIRQANLKELPFDDGAFEYVLCWGVLMHIPDVEAAITELARVVAPGGKFVLTEDNMHAVQPVTQRALQKVLGRKPDVRNTPAGLEKWRETEAGMLMTRQADVPWLIRTFERQGLRLVLRKSAQFTEAYARVSWGPAQTAIHRLNWAWFRYGGPPGLAFGNILVFERSA